MDRAPRKIPVVTTSGCRAISYRPRFVVLSAVCLVACIAADRALAGALDNSFVGTRAIAMAGAFTGIANDASAVSYNPAGLAFLASGSTHFEVYGYLSL